MKRDILERIVADRRARSTAGAGARSQGLALPAERPKELPVVPFPGPVICEIKRRSPSRGNLAVDLDPVKRAGVYRAAGAQAVSVLTEEAYFSGSLADLVAVKRAFPDLAVLRKDFLLDEEDVVVSWRAGADAILLIAAILEVEELGRMAQLARKLGIAALVEVHDTDELAKVAPLKPELIGINSRDLRTFRVDMLSPLAVAAQVDWDCRLVFESGVFYREDVRLAWDGGFSSVLVGEAVVRDPGRVQMLVEESEAARPGGSVRSGSSFWKDIATRRRVAGSGAVPRPLVKICGVCRVEDALLARDLGADVIGMIYAVSPRTAPAGLAGKIQEAGVNLPLVGVVLEGRPGENAELLERAQEDLEAGVLSALQLHGDSSAGEALQYGWPVYKAVRFSSVDEARDTVPLLRTPRFLIDAFDPKAPGGTGRTVEEGILAAATELLQQRPQGALWLAGGLNPETVENAVVRWRPELIDASSGLESEPGKKDPTRMREFFEAIDRVCERRV